MFDYKLKYFLNVSDGIFYSMGLILNESIPRITLQCLTLPHLTLQCLTSPCLTLQCLTYHAFLYHAFLYYALLYNAFLHYAVSCIMIEFQGEDNGNVEANEEPVSTRFSLEVSSDSRTGRGRIAEKTEDRSRR